MSTKPMMLVRAPVETRSGYGSMSRDIVRHLIELDKWDVVVWACPWGVTPRNALDPTDPKDSIILSRMVTDPLPDQYRQPEIHVSITVPNEYQPVGKYNIGITAGIETTACAPEWIEGMNRMNLILTISEHSKAVLAGTSYNHAPTPGAPTRIVKLEKPIEVLHNCVHTDVFKRIAPTKIEPAINDMMKGVKETFAFLYVGHWLKGNLGEDRKDVGMLVKVFLDTFCRVPKKQRPALILKTSSAGFSVLDRDEITQKVMAIKQGLNDKRGFPRVYLVHGDLSDSELNSLYNHPKVKAHVTFTKGEGFCRPLLEACMSGRPIIASAWSGHMDFLNTEEAILLGGELKEIGASSVWQGVINAGTKWFNVDYNNAANVLYTIWKHYPQFKNRGLKLATKNAKLFSYDAIKDRTAELMKQYVPEIKVQRPAEVTLPKLKKITPGQQTMPELPGLKKIVPKKPGAMPKKVDMSNG